MPAGGSGSLDDKKYFKCLEIKALNLAGKDEAKKMLQQAADQVQPIMIKRRWKVPLLVEFLPKNPALQGLNCNKGQKICIRMRRDKESGITHNYHFLLGTLLHELTHIVVSPHNAQFYALLAELTKECEELMAKGITRTGEGFDVEGVRLGGLTHNPTNIVEGKQKALKAAEERQRINKLMTPGGQRLGGDTNRMKGMSAREAAAWAAERRAKDDCRCKGDVKREDEVEVEVIDLTDDEHDTNGPSPLPPPSPIPPRDTLPWHDEDNMAFCPSEPPRQKPPAAAAAAAAAAQPVVKKEAKKKENDAAGPAAAAAAAATSGTSSGAAQAAVPVIDLDDEDGDAQPPAKRPASGGQWACSRCTVLNDAKHVKCYLCESVRPGCEDSDENAFDGLPLAGGNNKRARREGGGAAGGCGGGGGWACRHCTFWNESGAAADCGVCGLPRG
ncbi:unnamed protein product [Vitrella brassicaformis CCMP3155]|uniref:WLM domain-containing protein n=1 Tax=Vitrella brassicaformis (strain CCMP3155) TaxID=1169540 RepID=A0A0G4H856_VITBC|nr:unnamed protein product [Vitrella brassicaformis CCMP3155]|eukprot:CEM40093.1 unnamed protein product [Vitrella brassicaformis CCMP3155]